MASDYSSFMGVSHSNTYFFTNACNNDMIVYTETSNQSIHIGTMSNAQSQLKITSNATIISGNLGIGVANPQYKLDINGDLNFTGLLRQGGQAYIGSQWSTNSSNVFLFNSNVGIWTSNPNAALDCAGNAVFQSNVTIMGSLTVSNVQYITSNIMVYTSQIINSNLTVLNMISLSNSIGQVYMDSMGPNLGIGTDSPLESLTIVGSNVSISNSTGKIILTGASNYLGINQPSPTELLDINGGNVKFGCNLYVASNIGIGTSNPLVPLHLQIGSSNNGSNTGMIIYTGVGSNNTTTESLIIRQLTSFPSSRQSCSWQNHYDVAVPNTVPFPSISKNPMIWLRMEELSALSHNASVSSWPSASNSITATGSIAGTGSLPYIDKNSESYPFIRLGTDTVSSVNGSYFNCGSQTFNTTTNGGFTVVMAVRVRSISTGERVFDFGSGNPLNNLTYVRPSNDTSFMFGGYNTTSSQLISAGTLATNQWQIIVGRTESNGDVSFFTNDGTKLLMTMAALTDRTLTNTYIGKSSSSSDSYTNMDIREMIVFNAALTDTEIGLMRSYLTQKFTEITRLVSTPYTMSRIWTESGTFNSNSKLGIDVADSNKIIKTRMVIDQAGNVGIANSNPQFLMDVNGDLNFTGILRQSGIPYISSQWTNVSNNVFIMGSNVSIGVSNTTYALDVAGSVQFRSNINIMNSSMMFRGLKITRNSNMDSFTNITSTTTSVPGYSYSNDELLGSSILLNTDGIERFRINSNGYVGIGASNPTYNLYVTGNICATGDVTALSDERYKDNLIPISNATNLLQQINGYTYTRRDYEELQEASDTKHIGLVAQEVEKVLPEAISYDQVNDRFSINYHSIVSVLVEAIKEKDNQLKEHAIMIEDLKDRIGKLEI